MRSVTTKKLQLVSIFIVFFMVMAKSQTYKDVEGKWTGLQYLGSKPDTVKKSRGGFLSVHVYDSCRIILSINKTDGEYVTGSLYMYFVSDQAGSYLQSEIAGTMAGLNLKFRNTKVLDKKLRKYPAFHWCNGTYELALTKTGQTLLLKGSTLSPGCISGSLTLNKVAEKELISSISNEPAKPALQPAAVISSEDNRLYEAFKKRRATLVRSIEINSDYVELSFYDNGVIDNDTISVFVNSKLLFAHKKLEAKAYTVKLAIDTTIEINEIAMFADNLGSIPPNTSLMQLKDGIVNHDIYMSSNLNSNAVIKLKRNRNNLFK